MTPRQHRDDYAVAATPSEQSGTKQVSRGERRSNAGVESNARLTASTAVVLLVLLAIEGVTILRVGTLLTPHVVVGMILVPPVLVKIGATTWRFARYYRGAPAYRQKGPPPMVLRILGPLLVVLTVAVLISGIVVLIGPHSLRNTALLAHKASFVLWFVVTTIHVLGHARETVELAPRDWLTRTRRAAPGAPRRQSLIAASLVVGALLGAAIAPQITPYLNGHGGH